VSPSRAPSLPPHYGRRHSGKQLEVVVSPSRALEASLAAMITIHLIDHGVVSLDRNCSHAQVKIKNSCLSAAG
jgi:hypothetical protein